MIDLLGARRPGLPGRRAVLWKGAAMHIDTDEANAVALPRNAQGEIIK